MKKHTDWLKEELLKKVNRYTVPHENGKHGHVRERASFPRAKEVFDLVEQLDEVEITIDKLKNLNLSQFTEQELSKLSIILYHLKRDVDVECRLRKENKGE